MVARDMHRCLARLAHSLLFLSLVPVLLGAVRTPYADDPWIEVETPNFRLISNAEKAVTLSVATRLEQFRSMAAILTGANQIESALPVRVFVFGDGDAWSHFQEQADVAGYFVRSSEANFIALDVSRVEGESGLEIVFHEYVHFLSRNRKSRIHQPTWYEEGFADAISTARIEDGKIVVGRVPGGRAALLEEKKWLPLERVVTAKGYAGLSPDDMSMFYAQSWLLVHRLTWGHMAGFKPRHKEVIDYVKRVATGEPEETAFRAAIGTSFEGMEKELRDYLRKSPPSIVLDDEPPDLDYEPSVRTLPAETSLVSLGELQLVRGDEGGGEAEMLARQALKVNAENARAMLLLAEALARQGKDPGSELTVRALAIAPDTPEIVRAAARVALMRLQKVDLTDSDRRMAAVEARDLYTRAVTLAPESAAAHAGLGYAQLALNQPADAAKSLQQAFLMERFDLNVVLALGDLHSKYGRPEDARRLLLEVSGAAHADEMRARAHEILDAMDAKSAPP
jgi:Flp pilus assembly protein TadD